jgi:hypothetical protein
VRAHEDLLEVSATHLRADMLRTLYAVFDGEAEGILECRVPVSSPAAQGLQVEEGNEPGANTALDLEDIPVSWRALALDVLSGIPQPKALGSVTQNSYEVWAYRHDPASSVILRFFENEQAWSAAACRPAILEESPTFELALDQLFQTRVGGLQGPNTQAAIDADFEQLGIAEAMALLGRGLGLFTESGGIVYEPGLFGEARLETLSRIKVIRAVEGLGTADPGLSEFETTAGTLLDTQVPQAQLLWTKIREAQRLERVEVLKHRTYPGLILVHLNPAAPLAVSAFLPTQAGDQSPKILPALEQAIQDLVSTRKLLTPDPQPMPDIGPFVRIKDSEVRASLEEALQLLDEDAGIAVSYSAETLQEAEKNRATPTLGKTLIERPQGTLLH